MIIPHDQYRYILAHLPIVCVDVAILFNGKVLLIKRNDEPAAGEWWLPGGRLFKGEKLQECAKRKALEETGLRCRVGDMIHWASTDFGSVHSVNFCFQLYAQNDDVKLDEHSSDYRWYNIDDGFIFHAYVRECLSKIKI